MIDLSETGPETMFSRFLKDRSGATAIEYGMIIVCLSLVIIGGITSFGNEMETRFLEIGQFLKDTPTQ
jgi:pilus assembly protein Flp/PilA